MTLINLFIAVIAFGAQCWKRPFAHVDANRAESATLLCSLLVLILGLGSGASDSNDGVTGLAQTGLKYSIYTTGGFCLLVALSTLFYRIMGAYHSFRDSGIITKTEEQFQKQKDEAVPDLVREMLHKRKLQVALAWIGLTKEQNKDNSRHGRRSR